MDNKPWYKKWWGIITAILILPAFAVWFIWKKTSWNKLAKIGATGVIVAITISALANNEAPQVSNSATSQQVTTQPTQTTTPEVSQPSAPVTIMDKLWIAVDNGLKKRENVEINYQESSKEVELIYTSDSFWDETALVKGTVSTFVKYGMEAFKLDEVSSLKVRYRTTFTDPYGKSTVDDGSILLMAKTEFNKYQWPNLAGQPVMRQMRTSADEFYIHPAILKNLKEDKVTLVI